MFMVLVALKYKKIINEGITFVFFESLFHY